jgi:hypothetical protein
VLCGGRARVPAAAGAAEQGRGMHAAAARAFEQGRSAAKLEASGDGAGGWWCMEACSAGPKQGIACCGWSNCANGRLRSEVVAGQMD